MFVALTPLMNSIALEKKSSPAVVLWDGVREDG